MEHNKKRKLEKSDDEEEFNGIKLRCEYANVKVTVGGEKQGGTDVEDDKNQENKGDRCTTNEYNEKTAEKKVFWHYSQILASHSRYIDALLSAPLAAASKDKDDDNDVDDTSRNIKEISFPDISPSQWERMLMFVTDSATVCDMTEEDAIELCILYDKYDFHTGLKLCDKILSTIFYKDEEEFKIQMHDLELLDRCVQMVVLSHENNLKKTLVNGMKWLYEMFYFIPECIILTVDHIRKLVPVIACHSKGPDMCNVQDAIETRLSKKNLDILNPMFPELFVAKIQLLVARNTTRKLVNQIEIFNCAQLAGTYVAETDTNGNIHRSFTYIRNDSRDEPILNLKRNKIGDWIIEHDREELSLFICKGSRCETLPPKAGWKKVDGNSDMDEHMLPMLTYYRRYYDDTRVEIEPCNKIVGCVCPQCAYTTQHPNELN